MKNIKLFEEASQYEASKDGFEYPTVSYVKETDMVHYLMKPELYEWVDLGLSVKWATCNVGATKPEESGLYFAWGETQGYTGIIDEKIFSWSDYTLCDGTSSNMLKYNETDELTTLETTDDAAYTTDSSCRMPTEAECRELTANTVSEWVNDYNGTGVAGRIFTSNVNGNSIFVPSAGLCFNGSVINIGQYGYLWSSSLSSSYVRSAYLLNFTSGLVDVDTFNRFGGLPIRAVKE